jgi:hypothetical protein
MQAVTCPLPWKQNCTGENLGKRWRKRKYKQKAIKAISSRTDL